MATAGIFPNLDAVAETHRERDVAFFLKKKKKTKAVDSHFTIYCS